MLVKIKKLTIENEGYNRKIYVDNMYINLSNIVSITDYSGVNDFLLREGSEFVKDKFSLMKTCEGTKIEEVIVFGSAEQVYSSFKQEYNLERKLLRG